MVSEDTFNMNVNWLEKIGSLIDVFIYARFNGDFENMFISLDTLEMLTSPKIDDDELENKLKWLNENKAKVNICDENGNKIRINHKNREALLIEFRNCFSLLLIRLDEAGILTRLKQDPSKAMGNFDG